MTPDTLYHYTTKAFAEEVVNDLAKIGDVKAEVWEGTYGSGFYATDLCYRDATREQLRDACFNGWRPNHPMDGVLILDPGLAETPFQHEDERIWRSPGDAGFPDPIGQMILGVAVFENGGWYEIADEGL